MIKEGVIIGGRYEIMNRIGTGGMADVYKAVDRVLRRYVAVKVLKREFREDETFVQKFRSEAQAAAGLSHPNIVNVYDVAEDRGLYYIVMELVEGITLKEYIEKKGKLTPKEVIGITMQVCSGIDSAHSNNIIHRDIKPQNIMISKEGKVKVTDFGIAKATSSNTISTNAMGSVHYTSPEQARGGFSDAKSDIYSLGITMYEMITGELPFDGDTTVSIALKHLQEDIVPPSELVPDIPYSLEQIILKCTQKSPDRRYVDIAMLARDLKRSMQDPDGDFVKISPLLNVAGTITITQEELEQIQGKTKYVSPYDDDDEYDDYYDDDRRRRRQSGENKKNVHPGVSKVVKVLTIIAVVIFFSLVVGLCVMLIPKIGGNVTHNTDVERGVVPNMIGMTTEQAKDACAAAGLTYAVAVEEQSIEYDKGYIFKQLTQAGTKMPDGAKVQVYVSTGLKPIEMPDVVGDSEEDAISELKRVGFKSKKIEVEYEEHQTVKKGDVIRTNPKAGTEENSKSKIIIYVSKGVGETTMPYLVGKTPEEAKKLLEEAGLKGNPEVVESEEETEKVLEQEIEAGTKLSKGTTVKYMVSQGNTVEIPDDLVGKKFSEVKEILTDLGLKVVESKDPSSDKANGIVTYVQNAGKKTERGSEVTVKYSTNTSNTEGSGSGTE